MWVNVDKAATATRGGFSLSRLRSTHWGAAGYIMSAKAARTLSKQALKPTRPADQVLFDFDEKRPGAFVVYQLDPALCIQHDVLVGRAQRGSPLGSIVENERKLVVPSRKPKTPLTRVTSEVRKLGALIARSCRGRTRRKKIPYAGNA